MKRFFCILLALLFLTGGCLGEEARDVSGKYRLNENGEAVIDDVPFSDTPAPDDANRVFYEIFVGSFSDSDGDGVGDLRGVINRLDYLNDGDPQSGLSLGVEGIWLTPIFASPSYHKYDVTDFYTVDPAFGTMDDLEELIAECHKRGISLILDLPINHTGKDSAWFRAFQNAHLAGDQDSEYYNFYVWLPKDATVPAGRRFVQDGKAQVLYECNFSDSMPEPDFEQENVRQAMLDVALYYLGLGVDGFRFDAAKYIYFGDHEKSAAFWAWYMGELRNVKSDVYAVAEVWDGDGVIDRYLPIMNCFNFSMSQTGGLIAETAKGGSAGRFASYIKQYQQHLKELSAATVNAMFVSNHDMDRAAGYLTAASGQMQMAANLYLLSPGSPFIYYGEEIGMRGSRGGANTDANRRLAMLWGDGDTVRDPEGSTYPKDSQTTATVVSSMADGGSLYSYYKRLLMIRRANPEIARGEYTPLTFQDNKLGGFKCEWEGSRVFVIHNPSRTDKKLNLSIVTGSPVPQITAVIGLGSASLDGNILILEGQTSVVMR